jgi:hypothetical protein
MLDKQQVYERAKYLAYEFNRTGDDGYIIDAIVYAGVYYGKGGRKYIDIPPLMAMPMSIVIILVKAKGKFGNNITKNLNVLGNILGSQTNGAVRLKVDNLSSKSVRLSIGRVDNNDVRTLVVSRRLRDDDLINIGLAILDMYGNCGLELQHKRERFIDTLRRLIAYV